MTTELVHGRVKVWFGRHNRNYGFLSTTGQDVRFDLSSGRIIRKGKQGIIWTYPEKGALKRPQVGDYISADVSGTIAAQWAYTDNLNAVLEELELL